MAIAVCFALGLDVNTVIVPVAISTRQVFPKARSSSKMINPPFTCGRPSPIPSGIAISDGAADGSSMS